VILLGGIGFQPVRNTGKMTGWKPIPRFFHNLSPKQQGSGSHEKHEEAQRLDARSTVDYVLAFSL
jgi:hypothetical protein